jgi:beta-lactamase class A
MPPATYRQFNDATRRLRADNKTSDKVLVPLYGAAVAEDEQGAVQDAAFQAFASGELSKADFSRVLSRSRETEKQRTEKPWLASVRKSLATSLAPSDSEDSSLYAKRLGAIDALDEWVSANAGAKPDEVSKKAKEIGAEYKASSLAELRKSLAVPRYAGGPRQSMTQESSGVVAQRLSEAYRTGKISAEELNREAALLKRWVNLFDEESKIGTP